MNIFFLLMLLLSLSLLFILTLMFFCGLPLSFTDTLFLLICWSHPCFQYCSCISWSCCSFHQFSVVVVVVVRHCVCCCCCCYCSCCQVILILRLVDGFDCWFLFLQELLSLFVQVAAVPTMMVLQKYLKCIVDYRYKVYGRDDRTNDSSYLLYLGMTLNTVP